MTPHPAALGSALTHPHITTDFSECAARADHRRAHDGRRLPRRAHADPPGRLPRASDDELLWCCQHAVPPAADDAIPIGRYGNSNVGRAKTVYRTGLAHRYGRRMQTISGIHYNFSLPGTHVGRRVLRADPQLPPPLLAAALPVRRLARGVRELRRRPRPRAAAAARRARCTCRTRRRCAWAASATRATRRPRSRVSYNSLRQLRGVARRRADAARIRRTRRSACATAERRIPPARHHAAADRERVLRHDPAEAPHPARRAAAARAARARRRVRRSAAAWTSIRSRRSASGADRSASSTSSCCTACCSDSPPDTPEEIRAIGRNQHTVAARGREPGLRLDRGGRSAAPAATGGRRSSPTASRSPRRSTGARRRRLPQRRRSGPPAARRCRVHAVRTRAAAMARNHDNRTCGSASPSRCSMPDTCAAWSSRRPRSPSSRRWRPSPLAEQQRDRGVRKGGLRDLPQQYLAHDTLIIGAPRFREER